MSTWLEFRCEIKGSCFTHPADEGKCWSNNNVGPMDMAQDTRRSVVETLQRMETHAVQSGWVRTKEGWVCPVCIKGI